MSLQLTDRELYDELLAGGSRPTDTFEQFLSLRKWEREYIPMGYGTCDWPGPMVPESEWPSKIDALTTNCESVQTQRPYISAVLRWEVWERDDFTCQHCGVRRFLSIDHIVPVSKGGATESSNLQTLCIPCNSRKGAR